MAHRVGNTMIGSSQSSKPAQNGWRRQMADAGGLRFILGKSSIIAGLRFAPSRAAVDRRSAISRDDAGRRRCARAGHSARRRRGAPKPTRTAFSLCYNSPSVIVRTNGCAATRSLHFCGLTQVIRHTARLLRRNACSIIRWLAASRRSRKML
jgi:hypothetical protein